MQVRCMNCGRVIHPPRERAGKDVGCRCGRRVPVPAEFAELCPNCTSWMDAKAIVCEKCGYNWRLGAVMGPGIPAGVPPGQAIRPAPPGARSLPAIQPLSTSSRLWLGIAFGAGAAIICAVAWAAIGLLTGYEFKFVSIGIGGLVGLAVGLPIVGKNTEAGPIAAGFTILSIVLAKFMVFSFVQDNIIARDPELIVRSGNLDVRDCMRRVIADERGIELDGLMLEGTSAAKKAEDDRERRIRRIKEKLDAMGESELRRYLAPLIEEFDGWDTVYEDAPDRVYTWVEKRELEEKIRARIARMSFKDKLYELYFEGPVPEDVTPENIDDEEIFRRLLARSAYEDLDNPQGELERAERDRLLYDSINLEADRRLADMDEEERREFLRPFAEVAVENMTFTQKVNFLMGPIEFLWMFFALVLAWFVAAKV